jgi:hypothetical protein
MAPFTTDEIDHLSIRIYNKKKYSEANWIYLLTGRTLADWNYPRGLVNYLLIKRTLAKWNCQDYCHNCQTKIAALLLCPT